MCAVEFSSTCPCKILVFGFELDPFIIVSIFNLVLCGFKATWAPGLTLAKDWCRGIENLALPLAFIETEIQMKHLM